MTRALLLLATLAAGCVPALPEGVPLANAEPAVSFVLEHYGASLARRPRVWGVPSDCTTSADSPGFVTPEDGDCVSGSHFGNDIWLTVAPGAGYSYVLCHEVAHYLWGSGGDDHDRERGPLWGPGGKDEACSDALAARADLDGMEVLR
jgi:hypothetical protein